VVEVHHVKPFAPPPPIIAKIIERTTVEADSSTEAETETENETEIESEFEEPTVRQVSQLSFHSEPDLSDRV